MKRSKKYNRKTRNVQLIAIASLAIITATLAILKLMGLFVPIKINTSNGIEGLIAGGTTGGVTIASDGAIVCDSIVQGVKDCDLADGNYIFRVTGNNGTTTETKDYAVELINYAEDVRYSLADGETSKTISLGDTSTTYKMLVVKYHKNLTIDAGVTLTATTVSNLTYKKGMYICVLGNTVNNGSISMTARGTYNLSGENVYLWKNSNKTYEFVPAIGGTGGPAQSTSGGGVCLNGRAGNAGIKRATGGGGTGGGRNWSSSIYISAGGNGTSYSGGSGSGAANSDGGGGWRAVSGAGSSVGGAGGLGVVCSSNGSGYGQISIGGTGNPSGGYQTYRESAVNYQAKWGTGGLLIVYTKSLQNNGNIVSNGVGSSTSSISNTNGRVDPGGSSGGGSINIFAGRIENNSTISANGGAATALWTTGGAGGQGSTTLMELLPKMYYKDTSIQLKIGETYKMDSSKVNYSNYDTSTGFVLNGNISYEVADTSIANVDANGIITGLKSGKTQVKVIDNTNGIYTYSVLEVIDKVKIDVQEGKNFTVALKKNGTVWSYGTNTNGQLGNGKTDNSNVPCQVSNISNIKEISSGYSHTIALAEDGSVYTWGLNANGQLGNGDTANSNIPIKVNGLSNIVKINAYKNRCLALDKDGVVYQWGDGSSLPVKVILQDKITKIAGDLLLSENGYVYNISNLSSVVVGLENICEISSGEAHYLAVDVNGNLYAWGKNTYGECGTATVGTIAVQNIAKNIMSASAGNCTSIFQKFDGSVFVLGNNANGEIGLSTTAKVTTPIEIKLSDSSKIAGISAGEGTQSSLIDADGFVWDTGLNTQGELGVGNTTASKVFIKTGSTEIITNVADKLYLDINEKRDLFVTLANTYNLKIDVIDNVQSNFTIVSSDANKVSVNDKQVQAISYGNATLTITHTPTNKTKDITVISIMKMKSLVQGVKDTEMTDGDYQVLIDDQIYTLEVHNYYDDMEYSTDTELGDSTTDYKTLVAKYHKNLTIDKGVTLTAKSVNNLTYKKGMYVCVLGDTYNYGNISMTGKGTYNCSGENVYLWKNINDTYEYVPAVGGTGGASQYTSGGGYCLNGLPGNSGSARSTGGGGTGGGRNYAKAITISAGGTGTSYSGGSGSGASNSDGGSGWYAVSGAGSSTGGAGGQGVVCSSNGSGYGQISMGGTGNPSGGYQTYRVSAVNYTEKHGTGGLLILYSDTLYNSGNIVATGVGSSTASASNSFSRVDAGGSSGGGSVNIFAKTVSSFNTISANGGETTYLSTAGGAGGNGTVTINELGSVLNYNLKSLRLKSSDSYSIDSSKLSYTKLNTIQTQDLVLGNLQYESLDSSIASVDSTGKITAISNGITKIKITDTTNNYSTYILLTVSDSQDAQLESASNFTVALKQNGTVWAFGLNDKGQLGNGSLSNSNSPSQVLASSSKEALQNIVDICANDSSAIAVNASGEVFSWGVVKSLVESQVTDSTTIPPTTTTKTQLVQQNLPYATKVEGLSNIIKVSIYNGNYFAIDNTGKLYTWGKDYSKITSLATATGITDVSGNIVLGENGLVYKLSDLSSPINYIRNIAKISAGTDHYLFLDTEGNVYSLGKNSKGQLGNSQTSTVDATYPSLVRTSDGFLSNAFNISAGNMSSMAETMDGKVFAWGDNSNCKLGLTASNYTVATQITKGINLKNESIDIPSIDVVSTGVSSSTFADKQGFVYTVGLNKYGELGTNDNTSRTLFTKIGQTQISTVPDNLELLAGTSQDISVYLSNSFNLKTDIADVNNLSLKMINKNFATISAKSGIDNSNKTDSSQLTPNYSLTGKKVGKTILAVTNTATGDKKNIIVKVKSENGKVAPKVEAGNNFSVALKADGTVWAWGNNDYGQLGTGNSDKTNIPTTVLLPTQDNSSTSKLISDISVGYSHTLLLSDDGQVYSFGNNANGQLGIGNTQNKKSFVPVLMQNGSPLTGINKVVASKNTSFAIDVNGNIYAWGDGYTKFAQLINLKDASGNAVSDNVVDISKTYYLNEDGIVKKLSDCSVVTTKEPIMQISEGEDHTIFLGESQKAYSIGANVYGQLGDGSTLGKPDQVTDVLTSENTPLEGIQSIKAGNKFSIAITTDGKVYGFGINGNGEIGQETTTQESHFALLKSDITGAIDFDTGLNHNVVIKSDGNLFSWGLGEEGQLGNSENFDYIKAQLVGKNIVETNTNQILLQVGETYNLSAQIQYFNIFKDISSDIEYDSQDSSKVICGTSSGEVMAVDEGKTSIIAKDKITGNIAVVQVRILASGTKLASMSQLIEPQVSTAGSHTVMLKVDGSVWTYGQNDYGQLGNGTTTASDEPVQATFPAGTIITQVKAGDEHCIALDNQGNVWTWGRNNYYQLGNSDIAYSATPIKLTGLPKITKVAAGSSMSMLLTDAKEVYSFGLNADGEGGNGTYTNKILPTKAKYLTNIMDIAVARSHAIALKTTGEVYATGSNIYGQLGTSRSTRRNNIFTKISGLKKIARIDASDSSNVVANTDGQVYSWGSNIYGQLGTGDKLNKETPTLIANVSGITDVTVGKENTTLLDNQNDIYMVGENSEGQLGNNSETSATTYSKVTSISDIIDVSSGDTYTVALRKNGTVWGWGDYNHGDILLKSKTNSEIPVLVGNDTTGFNKNIITLKVSATSNVGANTVYQFNLINISKNFNDSLTYETLNDKIATIDQSGVITGVSVGTTWIRATDKNGKKYVVTIKVIDGTNTVAPEVKAGLNFTSVLKADGSIWSFGYNSDGELADATNIAKDVPTRTNVIATYREISVGKSFMVALRADNTAWASGDNTNGQLGTGDTKNENKLIQINGLTNIQKIATGDDYAVALDNYGILYGWGKNTSGQLGASNIGANTVKPTKIEGITSRIVDIAAGKTQTVVVTAKGTIFGLGKTLTGELSSITNAVKAAVGNGYILILTSDGNVFKYESGKATQISQISNAIDISVVNDVNMYQDKDLNVYTWGDNSNGQLGNNSKTDVTDPSKVYENSFTLAAGYNNSYIIKTSGEIYASGKNTYGALGNSVRDDSQEYVLVGNREFDISPASKIMTVNDVEKINISSNSFNAFNANTKDATQYTWTSSNDTAASVLDGTITAIAEGESTITAKDKITGVEKTALRVVVPIDKQRIKSINVNGQEAEISGEMKYSVKVVTDDTTGILKITTNDSTDKISIDGGNTWQENGTFSSNVTLENKSTQIPVIIKTSNGTEINYTLSVEKVSKDVGIKSLTVAGTEATPVSSTRYEISVDDATSYEIKGTTNNALASIGIDGLKQQVNTQTTTVTLDDKTVKEIPIVVTSESGVEQDYTLVIYKKSELLNLSKITVNGQEATKISENRYSITVNKTVTKADIIATAESALSNVNIANGNYTNKEAKASVTLSSDDNEISIKVQSGEFTKEYTLEIYRKADSDKLSMIVVNGNNVTKNSQGMYEIYLPNIEDSAVVRAIAASTNYYVKIADNDKEKSESEKTVLTPNISNSYTIIVTDENNVDTSYTLLIKKAESDTTLKQIIAINGTDQRIAQKINDLEYEVRVPNTYLSVNLQALTGYANSKIQIEDNVAKIQKDTKDITLDTSSDTTDVKITVISENGQETTTYTLHIIKMSSDNSLKEVKVGNTVATLQPDGSYAAQLTEALTSVSVQATSTNENADVKISTSDYSKQTSTKEIVIDSKEVTTNIYVQAEDGTTKQYVLKITGLPDDTNIQKITVNNVEAVYNSESNQYEIRADDISYNVVATLEDNLATVQLMSGNTSNAYTQATSSLTVPKAGTETIVYVNTKAQNGIESQTYKLVISEKSSNTNIDTVTVNGLTAIADKDGNYTSSVNHLTENLNIVATAEDAKATMMINTTTQNKQVASLTDSITSDTMTYTLTVTSEKGTIETKQLVVKKLEGNINLNKISLGTSQDNLTDATLKEDGTYYYKAERTDSIYVKAIAESSNSNVKIGDNVQELQTSTKSVKLDNEITKTIITVIGQDGSTKDYTLNIEKQSNDNSIKSITSDTKIEVEKLDSETGTTYNVYCDESVSSLPLVITANSSLAKTKLSDSTDFGTDSLSTTVTISAEAAGVINVDVKAEDGEIKTYTINVNRRADLSIQSVKVNSVEIPYLNDQYNAVISVAASTPITITTTNSAQTITLLNGTTTLATAKGTLTTTATLASDLTTLTVRVTSNTGMGSQDKTLIIRKKSQDNSLSYIKVDGYGTTKLTDTTYKATVSGKDTYPIEIKSKDSNATVKLNSGSYSTQLLTDNITLADGETKTFTITVKSENGEEKAYTLTVERVSSSTDIDSITVENLKAGATDGTTEPVTVTKYNQDTKTYTIVIDKSLLNTNVVVNSKAAFTKLVLDKQTTQTKTATLNKSLSGLGTNTVTIDITAADGTLETRYLNIVQLSDEINLSYVKVSGMDATKDEIGNYSIIELETTNEVSIEAKSVSDTATVKVNDQVPTTSVNTATVSISGKRQVAVPIQVTAENGTSYTYTLTINVISNNTGVEYVKSNNINAEVTDNVYTVFVAADATTAIADIKTTSNYAKTKIDDVIGNNMATVTMDMTNTDTTKTFQVIAENGDTKDYIVKFVKKSQDNTLKELSVDGNVITADANGKYTVDVVESKANCLVKAIATNEYAMVKVANSDVAKQIQTSTITLNTKQQQVTITVTSQNGEIATYTLTINHVSEDNSLSYVNVNGKAAQKISTDENNKDIYKIFIPEDVSESEVDIKATNDYATIKETAQNIAGDNSGVSELKLTKVATTEKVTTITFEITSESQVTKQYELQIAQSSNDNTIKEIYVDGNLVTLNSDGKYVMKVLDTDLTPEVKVIANNEYAIVRIALNSENLATAINNVTLSNTKTTTVPITIRSQSGITKVVNLYIEKIATSTNLESVVVDGQEVTTYNSKTKTYSAIIESTKTTAEIFAMAESNYATVELEGESAEASITKNIDIPEGTDGKTVTIKVISENNNYEEYQLQLIRKSTDTTVTNVEVNDKALTAMEDGTYTTIIPKLAKSVKIKFDTKNMYNSIQVADQEKVQGEAIETLDNLSLAEDKITVPVIVVAADGITVKTYNIILIRGDNTAEISELTIDGEKIEAKNNLYEKDTLGEDKVTVKITAKSAKTKIEYNGQIGVGTLETEVELSGVNTINTVKLTSEDETVTSESVVQINRLTGIVGTITTENIEKKHTATIKAYLTSDTRTIGDATNPREEKGTITTDINGTYKIKLDAAGTYDVVITKAGYLESEIDTVVVEEGNYTTIEETELIGGDVEGTGEIELDDLVAIEDNYCEITTTNKANKGKYDINEDGKVDSIDREIVKKNYGRRNTKGKWNNGTITPVVENANYIKPLAAGYVVTSEYGERKNPVTGRMAMHSGIDISGQEHEGIKAVAGGTVTYAGVQSGYGNCVEIKHEIEGKEIYTFYGHLSEIDVSLGEAVEQGKIIGKEGGGEGDPNRGTSTGAHLHFEIRNEKREVQNPRDYINF